jgi:hypothetical protein
MGYITSQALLVQDPLQARGIEQQGHVAAMSVDMKHTVRQGECIDSIAFEHGFFVDTLWNYVQNRALKQLRKDPNILQPGDIVMIPERTLRKESCITEKKHTFKRKGVPAKLRLVFYRPKPAEEEQGSDSSSGASDSSGFSNLGAALAGSAVQADDESVYQDSAAELKEPATEPIANTPYILHIDRKISQGQSDGDGKVEIAIMPNARRGLITFYAGTEKEISFSLKLGEMDSIETVIGVRKRLYNLAYRCSPDGDKLDPDLKDALRRFQEGNGLPPVGDLDQATKDKLVQVHGS